MEADEVSRRFRAVATAVTQELQHASQSALVRALPIIIAVTFVAGIVAGFLGISDVVAREPLATLIAAGALVVTFAVILGIVLWRVLGGRRWDVLDVLAVAAREARREWTVASPGSSVPRSARQARGWLATHPETDANRPQRMAVALMAGDLAGARETLERYPVGTAFERHRQAADRLAIDLVAGRTVTAPEIGAAYAELGSEHEMHAITCRSVMEASAALLSNDDWHASLVRARPRLPAEAMNIGRRWSWLVLLATNVAIFALVIGAIVAAWTFILR